MHSSFGIDGDDLDSDWLLDSGASHHFTFDGHQVHNASTCNGKEGVLNCNGQKLPIKSIGSGSFPVSNNYYLPLRTLLHTSNATANILSVHRLYAGNGVVEFHPNVFLCQGSINKEGCSSGHKWSLFVHGS